VSKEKQLNIYPQRPSRLFGARLRFYQFWDKNWWKYPMELGIYPEKR